MRVHHIAFRTHDLAALERFYVEVLRFSVKTRLGQRSVWLDAGDAILMLEKAAQGEPKIPAKSMEFVAFAIRPTERDPMLDRLEAYGISVEHRTEYTIYFRDPDGRRVGVSYFDAHHVL
ncbi:MAG: VOC family protein [Polyangiaceae bacterium]